MSEAVFSQEAVGETRAWLEHIHAELEKKPARELFARFNRDLTVRGGHEFVYSSGVCRVCRFNTQQTGHHGGCTTRCSSYISNPAACHWMPRGVHTVATSCASHNIEFAAWSSQCYLRHRLRLTPLFCCWPPVPQIQVVNQASQFIQRAFDWRAEEGQQKIDEAQFRKAKCSLYLYYKCATGSNEPYLIPESTLKCDVWRTALECRQCRRVFRLHTGVPCRLQCSAKSHLNLRARRGIQQPIQPI